MADQKKWFKNWTSILTDSNHANLSLADVGRWTRLLAYVAQSGTRGRLVVKEPSKMFCLAFEESTLEATMHALNRLPGVQITPPLQDNGCFTVIIKKWFRYQVDSTAYDRVKRSRIRREEKRREERDNGVSSSTSKPLAGPYGG